MILIEFGKLYANCIPVVQDHVVFSKFKQLPIIFVNSFKNINPNKFEEISQSKFKELADFRYWKKKYNEKEEKTLIINEFVNYVDKLNNRF